MSKRILFISNSNPYSTKFGAEQRSNVLLKALIRNEYDIDVAYTGIMPYQAPTDALGCNIVFWNESGHLEVSGIDRLKYLTTYAPFPRFSNIAKPIREIICHKEYDFIVCRYLTTVYGCGIEDCFSKLIVDLDDYPLDSLKVFLKDKTDFLHKVYHQLFFESVKRATLKCRRISQAAFLANKDDAIKYSLGYLPNISIHNAEEVCHIDNCKNLIFIGKLDYLPNIEGVDKFLCNVWDSVVKRHPDSRFLIGGMGIKEETRSRWSSFPNVSVIGYVDDIIAFYNSANIAVCPIYSGSGTNIKSIEALSMGKATVMTQFSAKGISNSLKDSENSIISKSDKDMVNSIDRLLTDDAFCLKIQTNGLALAKELFSIGAVSNILSSIIDGADCMPSN